MNTYAKPVETVIIFNKNQAEMSSPEPFSLSIYDIILCRLSEEGSFRQLKAHNNVPGSTYNLSTPQKSYSVGGGKTLTSLGSPRINNIATGLGAHSQTKTMGPGPLQIRWLKSTLAHYYFLMDMGQTNFWQLLKIAGHQADNSKKV